MQQWAIRVAYLLASLFVLLNGLLMLFSPHRHARFLHWLSQAEKWSKPATQWKRGLEIGRRLGGLGLALTGLLLLRPVLFWINSEAPTQDRRGEIHPTQSLGSAIFSLALASGMVVFGAWLLGSPRVFVGWCARQIPGRQVSESYLHDWELCARFIGALTMLGGIGALISWLNS